jgi:hypothetical protein
MPELDAVPEPDGVAEPPSLDPGPNPELAPEPELEAVPEWLSAVEPEPAPSDPVPALPLQAKQVTAANPTSKRYLRHNRIRISRGPGARASERAPTGLECSAG